MKPSVELALGTARTVSPQGVSGSGSQLVLSGLVGSLPQSIRQRETEKEAAKGRAQERRKPLSR